MNNRRLEKTAPSVLQVKMFPNLTVYSSLAAENQWTVTLVKQEKIDSRGQTVLRKRQVVCTGAETESLKKYHFKNIFNCIMCMKEKMQRMNLTPLPTPKRSVPVQVPLNNENVPKEIKQLMEQGYVDSVTFYGMEYGMKASYTVAYKKQDRNSHYTTYEFFIVDPQN